MGQGQEPAAHALVAAGFTSGDCPGGEISDRPVYIKKNKFENRFYLVKPIVMSSQEIKKNGIFLAPVTVYDDRKLRSKKTMHFAYQVWFSFEVLIFAILVIRTVAEI